MSKPGYPIYFHHGPLGTARANAERLPPALYFLVETKREIYVYVRAEEFELQYEWDEARSKYMTANWDIASFAISDTPQPQVTFQESE